MPLQAFIRVFTITTTLVLFACSQDKESVAPNETAGHEATSQTAKRKPYKISPPPKPISTANAVAKLNQVITNTLRDTKLPDFNQYTDVKQKKHAFFAFLRPLVVQTNKQILRLRDELSHIDPTRITKQQKTYLKKLARTYKIKTSEPEEQLALLLRKIQVIPEALVLAQAANESAWGTSRFAVKGNNLFGQWCFKAGCGLVPSGRPSGANYEVRLFKTPQDSVSAYARNLNSHGGYLDLRKIRACLLDANDPITGRALASGLLHYSSRGVAYINEIKQLIRVNKLEVWDKNWWGEQNPGHACYSLVQVPEPIIETVPMTESQLASDAPLITQDTPKAE